MRISGEFFARIVGAFVCATLGAYLGFVLSSQLDVIQGLAWSYIVALGLVGFLVGLILTPYVTVRPMRRLRMKLMSISAERLVALIGGIFLGLVGSALLTIPLSTLPEPLRSLLPLLSVFFLCYLAVAVLSLRQGDLRSTFSFLRSERRGGTGSSVPEDRVILLDTSVIIDGRIADISRTGFLRASLLVPNFILLELQHIADSPDPLRRNRGRRGMDVLRELQQSSPVPVRFTDMDVTDVRDVDSKLVALARDLDSAILTNDYNLNRIAELQGVTVLNINELANAVRAVYLPGEELGVKIVQEGREIGQGVGYLDDGTMVVVEEGRRYLDQGIDVVVTKVLQTSAGRMIFARPRV
jgi:uncharacterized protein YacL